MSTSTLPPSISGAHAHVLEAIGNQFHLSSERLIAITKKFVEDFMVGLGEYSHPMAMM